MGAERVGEADVLVVTARCAQQEPPQEKGQSFQLPYLFIVVSFQTDYVGYIGTWRIYELCQAKEMGVRTELSRRFYF